MPDRPRFTKSPPELVDRFNAVVGRVAGPAVVRKPMFGYPCAWVGGNMATGLFATSWWVRLPQDRMDALVADGRARGFEVMPGRPMRGYVAMADGVLADDAAVETWVAEALAYTATLPPKAK